MEKENNSHALTVQPSGAIAVTAKQNGLLARMTSGVLATVRTKSVQVDGLRFRLGKYEFREPDYRQIELWAKTLNISAEAVLVDLEASRDDGPLEYGEPAIVFEVKDGAILSLVWNFSKLPICSFDAVKGLQLQKLSFIRDDESILSTLEILQLNFPSLVKLFCFDVGLKTIHLSNVPRLTKLDCDRNDLTELDLSKVPMLTELNCTENQLTEIDLSKVPMLTELYCHAYQLTKPDFSNVPMLTKLWCGDNQLTELDLSKVPMLTELMCVGSPLTELDLSKVPMLTKLVCWSNQLTTLDLSNVPMLTELECWNNQLTELDLSNVPMLTKLNCKHNQLTNLDLSNVPLLMDVKVDPLVYV